MQSSNGFNDLRVPAAVLPDWYGGNLNVYGLVAARPAEAPGNPDFAVLGNNNRHVLILVNEPGQAFLSDSDLQFLGKMLSACGLNLGDVAIVNHARQAVPLDRLRTRLSPETVILFGVDPVAAGMPIRFPAFKPQPFDGCRFLLSPSLSELNQPSEEGKLLKSKLWLCLKDIFGL